MRGFVDRVVDGIAVILLEGGGRAYVPTAALPAEVEAGAVVEVKVARVEVAPGSEGADEVAELIERLRAGEHRHG